MKPIWRAVDIRWEVGKFPKMSLLRIIWGSDIWLQGIPVLKCLVLANAIVWAILFWTLR